MARFSRLHCGHFNGLPPSLVERRKGDPEKLAIAVRLRQETSLSLKRIAARLHLGSPRAAGERLREWIQQQALSEVQRQAELGL